MRRRIFGDDANQPDKKLPKRLGFDDLEQAKPKGLTLPERLLRDWAKGDLSSKQIQDYCEGGVVSGCDESTSQFAHLGADGKYAGNIQRDLLQLLGKPVGAPKFMFVKVPILNKHKQKITIDMPLLVPHRQFASLYRERPEFFKEHVTGTSEDLAACWKHLGKQDFLRPHPAIAGRNDFTERCAPLGLHGDAGAFAKKQSLFVLTWNGLVAQGRTRQTRFVMAVFKKTELCPDGSTLDAIWKALAWSFNALAEGKWPTEDWDGNPFIDEGEGDLADGWRGACCQMRGDWQWLCQVFHFHSFKHVLGLCCWQRGPMLEGFRSEQWLAGH